MKNLFFRFPTPSLGAKASGVGFLSYGIVFPQKKMGQSLL
jgi:hypothetical protein